MITRLFRPPHFNNNDDNFRAMFINGFAWIVIALLTLAIIPYLIKSMTGFDYTVVVLLGLIVVLFTSIYLLKRGNIYGSGIIVVVLGWLGITIQALTADGVKDVIIVAYIAIGLLASIVISWRSGGIVILASIGAIWALAFLEANQVIIPRFQDPLQFSRDLSIVFLAITVLIYFSTNSLRDAVGRATKSEEQLSASNQSLQELNQTLEERISNRTAELEIANERNEHRAKQFEAIAQVARATASNQNLESLLTLLVQVISEQFGFYHAGIFLLDEKREFAVLRASNSEGGKRMVTRDHKLKIGQTGIVGFVAASGIPRIALDVEKDAVFFDNPDLPDTRSELAMPLRIANEIIGVLDIQSTQPNTFHPEDMEVLSTLTDQVSIAIQNARAYESSQALLVSAQKTSGSFLQNSWAVLQSQKKNIGYQVSNDVLKPLDKIANADLMKKATTQGETVVENGENANLTVPIRLGSNVVGVINIHLPEDHNWEEEEIDIIEEVAGHLSLALESAIFLQATQRHAEIERLTADITGKIGSTTQFNSIIRTAAEELSRALGGSDVLVQIQPDALEKRFEA